MSHRFDPWKKPKRKYTVGATRKTIFKKQPVINRLVKRKKLVGGER